MNKKTFVERLVDIFVKRNTIAADKAPAIKKLFYDRSKPSFVNFLLEEDLLSREDILNALSDYYNVPAFDVEGYFFEHVYSYDWQAMKGFHYLMKVGHFLNAMAVNSEIFLEYVNEKGIRGFISDLWLDLSGAALDMQRIGDITAKKYIWKLKTA